MGVGADASGGRIAELLKVGASGSGVVTRSGAWTWSSATERRALECCSFSSRRERYCEAVGDDLPSAQKKPFATIPNAFVLHSTLKIYKETSSG